MKEFEFILYISDQARSRDFYGKLFQKEAILDVAGMTEFQLMDKVKLGLMPEKGIAKIISGPLPHPEKANGIPRCELYVKVKNAGEYLRRGIALGAREITTLQKRDWGDTVGYISDPDGHVIALAEE